MAVTDPYDDPQAQLRRRLINRPALVGATPEPLERPPGTLPAVPAPPVPVAAPTGAPIAPAAPKALPGGVTLGAGGDKGWLDWIAKTYGTSASRGAGFADLPAGTTLEQAINRFNQETGATAKFLGGPSGDRVDFGQGVTDALTAGGQLWSDYGAMGGAARAGAGVPNGRAGGVAGAVGAAGAAGGAGDYQSQIRNMLLQRLTAAGQPVDPNSGGIGDAMNAARLEADRMTQMERTALAERRAATGDTSGSLEQGIQQSAERNAVGLGSLRAKLIQQEYQTKRQELQEMLQLATASGDAQSARDVQVQLANLDATLRREGYSLDAAKFGAGLDQQAVLAGLG